MEAWINEHKAAWVAETTGSFSYDETSSSEQQVVEISISEPVSIGTIHLDMTNVTQDTTIKVYHKTDGTNYREMRGVGRTFTVSSDADGETLDGFRAYGDVKITFTCGGAGAGSISVPFVVV